MQEQVKLTRTKIVATIGPASQDEETLSRLAEAGVDIFRVNFSHGDHQQHRAVIERIRKIATRLSRPIAILQDLQGPKIRVGEIADGSIELSSGNLLTLTTKPIIGDNQNVSVDYPGLPKDTKPGQQILLDDGNLELKILRVGEDYIETQVVLGGILKSHKGVNLPGCWINLPAITAKDEADLEFGLNERVDAVAISFVRQAEDIRALRNKIQEYSSGSSNPMIIAKLEQPEALENLDEIIDAADGVMVARGDLGVEMAPETVPIAQKRIITCANKNAKLVITATQMLDSMIRNPRPTRAEASDIANAIFDGTDAVMLSGETAVGDYPIESVRVMDAIIRQAEEHLTEWGRWPGLSDLVDSQDDAYFITLAARELAHDRNVAAITVFTKSGRTALLMSKARPSVPILAFTPHITTYHRLNFLWGVHPYLVQHSDSIEKMISSVKKVMLSSSNLEAGQQIVLVCGFPIDDSQPANLALLYTID
jgi:pyruvate kinase